MELVSIPISIVSLIVSLGTFWLAFIHRGRLKMTKPTIVFFGYDMVPRATPKVFLRTLLYSTATRGQVVEGMFAKVKHGDSIQVCSFWGYAETEKLTAGSGLHVSKTGFAANHHFVLSVHEAEYRFEPGDYDIEVLANVIGRKGAVRLSTIRLTLNPDLASALARHEGVLFERKISGEYEGHTR
jgi:hypothetical protein